MLQRGGSLALSGFGHSHQPSGGGGGNTAAAAAAAAGGTAAGPPPVVKQMNNYLGIGVDAKASGRVAAVACTAQACEAAGCLRVGACKLQRRSND